MFRRLCAIVFAACKFSLSITAAEPAFEGKTALAWADQLKAADWFNRWQAADALTQMGPDAFPATDALVDALWDMDAVVNVQAMTALGGIGKPAVPRLIEELKNVDSKMERFDFNEVIQVPPILPTYTVTRALGAMGKDASSAVPLLVKTMVENSNYEAIDALGRIGSSSIAPLKEQIERHFNGGVLFMGELAFGRCIEALTAIGPQALPAMKELFQRIPEDDDETRRQILFIRAFGRLGNEGVSLANPFLDDESPKLRDASFQAICSAGSLGLETARTRLDPMRKMWLSAFHSKDINQLAALTSAHAEVVLPSDLVLGRKRPADREAAPTTSDETPAKSELPDALRTWLRDMPEGVLELEPKELRLLPNLDFEGLLIESGRWAFRDGTRMIQDGHYEAYWSPFNGGLVLERLILLPADPTPWAKVRPRETYSRLGENLALGYSNPKVSWLRQGEQLFDSACDLWMLCGYLESQRDDRKNAILRTALGVERARQSWKGSIWVESDSRVTRFNALCVEFRQVRFHSLIANACKREQLERALWQRDISLAAEIRPFIEHMVLLGKEIMGPFRLVDRDRQSRLALARLLETPRLVAACQLGYSMQIISDHFRYESARENECFSNFFRFDGLYCHALALDARLALTPPMGTDVTRRKMAAEGLDSITIAFRAVDRWYLNGKIWHTDFYQRLALYIKFRRLNARLRNDLWSELAALEDHVAYLRWAHDRQRFDDAPTTQDPGELNLTAFLLALAEEERRRFVEAKFVSSPPREPEPLLPKEEAEIFGLPYNLLLP
ncbi:MAG: hypothetical protein U1D30_25830 [Planctomycetota bacterium]